MFIELNDIKGIIIDLDSFSAEIDEHWIDIDEKVKLLFFSKEDKERLEKISKVNNRFNVYLGTPITIFAKKNILIEMLNILEVHSYETAFLSNKFNNLTKIQALPISTIQFNTNDILSYNEVGELADFQISSLSDLNSIISKETIGYFSEAASIIYNYGEKLNSKYASLIITEKEYCGYKCIIVSGGRYFNTYDVRSWLHQLSQRIVKNKRSSTRQDNVFIDIYGAMIKYIDENIKSVDSITRIPSRPSESDDRFLNVVEKICLKNSKYSNYSMELSCIKEYPSQKGLNAIDRETNIKGVFRSTNKVKGKHVVLIDDIISTGSTAFEAAKTMYEEGATKVTILVLAINQLSNNIRQHNYSTLKCECGKEFKMNFNKKNNSAFFGCSGYFDDNCKNSMNYLDGIKLLRISNEIKMIEEDAETDLNLNF